MIMFLKILIMTIFGGEAMGKKLLGFFPHTGRSEHNVIAPILHELLKRGHHVVYLTPVPPPFSHDNLDVRIMNPGTRYHRGNTVLMQFGEAPVYAKVHYIAKRFEEMSDFFYGDPEAQKIIHDSESYDAVMMQSFFYQEPVSALIHKYGCPGIDIISLGDSAWGNELAGFVTNTAYQIDFHSVHTDKLSFWERLHNFYVTWATILVSYYHLWRKSYVMDKYFNYTGWENRPPLSELISNRSLILLNRDIVMDYPYPQPPHVKEVGGVNILPNKPLPKNIKYTMDRSTFGAILFSLGSHVNTGEFLKTDVGKAVLAVFKKLPQNIILKFESDEAIDFPENVKTYKWIPQQDVLAHKNCVLFITHGGLLSLTEAVYNAVPVIGIPFFGDQPKNMEHVEMYGYGLKMKYDNITEKSLSWAIHEVLNNSKYAEVIKERSEILRDKRERRVEEAVYWIEHTMKYPNFLTPRGAYLTFIQLHNIDINIFIVSLCFAILFAMKTIYGCLINIFPRKSKIKIN